MNAILSRALVASAAAAAVAASSPFALAEEEYATPPSSAASQATPSRGRPQIIIAAPPRDVATYTEKTPNGALIGSGAAMFGISYGASLVVAATSDRPSDQHLFIPVAGPWIDLTNRGAGLGQELRGPMIDVNETANKVLLVTSGIFQAVGAAQVVAGFMFPETRTVTRTIGVHVTPTAGKGMVGLAAYGSF